MSKKAKKKDDLLAPLSIEELEAPISEEELLAPLTAEEMEEKPFYEEYLLDPAKKVGQAIMEPLQAIGEGIEEYDEAPGRKGLQTLFKTGSPTEAFEAYKSQIGEDAAQAPSYSEVFDPLVGEAEFTTPATEERFTKYGARIPARPEQKLKYKDVAGTGLAVVGAGPASLTLSLTPAGWLAKGGKMTAKGIEKAAPLVKEGAKKIAYLPMLPLWEMPKIISGINKKSLSDYIRNTEKVDAYLETYGLDGLRELATAMKEKFGTRVSTWTRGQNKLIQEYLGKNNKADIDVTGVFDELNSKIDSLDPVGQRDARKYLIDQRNNLYQYFDEPIEKNGRWVSKLTGKEVYPMYDKGSSRPTSMLMEIDGEMATINLRNREEGARYLVDAKTAYNIKKNFQDLAYDVKEKGLLATGLGPVTTSLRSAASAARMALHQRVPEIALADTAISKLHLAQRMVSKALLDPYAKEYSLLAAGRTGGSYERKVLEGVESVLTDPKSADELLIFQDAMSKQIDELKQAGQLEEYALEIGFTPEQLEYYAKSPMPAAMKEGVETYQGVPVRQGTQLDIPSTQLSREAELLHTTQQMGKAQEQLWPQHGAFLGAASVAGGHMLGDPIRGFLTGLMFMSVSPKAVKAVGRTGSKVLATGPKMVEMAQNAGLAVKDGMIHLTPDFMKDVFHHMVGAPVKKGAYMMEKVHELMQTPAGEEMLMDAIKAALAGRRIIENVEDMKITTPDQSRAYIKDVQKEAGLSNIEKFKRIQKANKERRATLDMEEPQEVAMPEKQALLPQDVFKVLKGGA